MTGTGAERTDFAATPPSRIRLVATIAFSSRLICLQTLEEVGFRTPSVTFEKPAGEYVAKDYYIWNGDPELNGEGDFYEELVPTKPVDYKYYTVNDGECI